MNARLQRASPDLDGILARLSASQNADEAEAAASELREVLKAELASPSTRSAAAFVAASKAIDALPPERASSALVECLLTISHYLYLATQADAALQPTAAASRYARTLGDKPLLRKALTHSGGMQIEAGNFSAGLTSFAAALEVARDLGDLASEAPVWNNLGAALMSASHFADALKCFAKAVSLAHGFSEPVRPVALANISSCAIQIRDVDTGLNAVRQAIELNLDPTTSQECLDRVLAESCYARLLLEADDLARAEECLDAARLYATKAPSARAEYISLQTSGLVDVHAGRVDKGLTRLRMALDYARQHVRSDVQDALAMCVAGYEAAGQLDRALFYLDELLALNRDSGAVQTLMRQLLEDPSCESDQAVSQYEAQLTSDAARLQAAVDARLKHLVNAAINAGLASGYDMYRVFRVSKLAELFATQEGWPAEQVQRVALAAKLIDIGMIATPEPLLTKTRGLSEGERKVVDDHTRFGAELLAQASLAMLQPCIPVVRFHHERWDGSGPWSLKGEAIPLEARLVALCDAFDAMTHPRPWRTEPLTPAMALREIAAQAGRRFDPELAARFVDFVQREFWKHDRFLVVLGEEGRNNDYVQARERIATMMASSDRPS
jgi:putative two-component system response regulator